jgi:hypothetical protein
MTSQEECEHKMRTVDEPRSNSSISNRFPCMRGSISAVDASQEWPIEINIISERITSIQAIYFGQTEKKGETAKAGMRPSLF